MGFIKTAISANTNKFFIVACYSIWHEWKLFPPSSSFSIFNINNDEKSVFIYFLCFSIHVHLNIFDWDHNAVVFLMGSWNSIQKANALDGFMLERH